MSDLPEIYDRFELEEQLREIQQKIDDLKTQIYFSPQSAAPVDVEVGTLAFSDGTNTDNTFGNSAEGFYYYSSATNWVPVAIGGTNSTISLPDSTLANPSIALGNSQDFKIYHEEDSGTGRSFIRETGNGSLILIGTDFQVRTGDADGNKYRITTDDGNTGGVKLHFGNAGFSDAIKFETTAEGCSVTGAVTTDKLIISDNSSDNVQLQITNGAASFEIRQTADATGTVFVENGTGNLTFKANDFFLQDSSDSTSRLSFNETKLKLHDGSGNIVLETTTGGVDVIGRIKITPQSAAPSSPSAGMIYYDSDDNKLKLHNGTSFVDLN